MSAKDLEGCSLPFALSSCRIRILDLCWLGFLSTSIATSWLSNFCFHWRNRARCRHFCNSQVFINFLKRKTAFGLVGNMSAYQVCTFIPFQLHRLPHRSESARAPSSSVRLYYHGVTILVGEWNSRACARICSLFTVILRQKFWRLFPVTFQSRLVFLDWVSRARQLLSAAYQHRHGVVNIWRGENQS